MAAAKGNCYNPNGRPRKDIDWQVFEDACGLLCTQEEMEGLLHVDRNTLMDRVKDEYGEDYSAVYKRFSAGGKKSLRRTQFKLAQKNAAMAIFLGKQHLGQKDTPAEMVFPEEVSMQFMQLMNQLSSLQASPINSTSVSKESGS